MFVCVPAANVDMFRRFNRRGTVQNGCGMASNQSEGGRAFEAMAGGGWIPLSVLGEYVWMRMCVPAQLLHPKAQVAFGIWHFGTYRQSPIPMELVVAVHSATRSATPATSAGRRFVLVSNFLNGARERPSSKIDMVGFGESGLCCVRSAHPRLVPMVPPTIVVFSIKMSKFHTISAKPTVYAAMAEARLLNDARLLSSEQPSSRKIAGVHGTQHDIPVAGR